MGFREYAKRMEKKYGTPNWHKLCTDEEWKEFARMFNNEEENK